VKNYSIRRKKQRKAINVIMLGLTGMAALLVISPLLWILGYILREGLPALTPKFLTQLPTPVGVPGGGIVNALIGSLMTVGLGTLIAAPIGVLGGLYAVTHSERPLGVLLRFSTDVISGVPSIVMGIFAYTLVVLPQKHFSAFSGGVVLAFIMLPIIIRTTEEMVRLVPGSLREASLALGAAEWKTSVSVMLPAALDGVITGVMLAIARAAGEAAPMLFTAFGNPFMNANFNQPVATLPQTIFVYAISPYPDWHANAWATALVLIMLILMLNIGVRLWSQIRSRRLKG
jgi:phosphate transport system permease protein